MVREVHALAGFGRLPDFQSVSRKILMVGLLTKKFEAGRKTSSSL